MNEIVVNPALITGATVLLGFIINTVLVKAGISLSDLAKKLVVFTVAVGLTAYAAHQGGLPQNPPSDPAELALYLLTFATAVFKVAQVVYDQIKSRLS